jgi:protein deglycase
LRVIELIKSYAAAGKPIAAICAAPLLLHDAGVLEGRAFTGHFSITEELPENSEERVVRDGELLTSRGAGTAVEFGLALVEMLVGREKADEVGRSIMV